MWNCNSIKGEEIEGGRGLLMHNKNFILIPIFSIISSLIPIYLSYLFNLPSLMFNLSPSLLYSIHFFTSY